MLWHRGERPAAVHAYGQRRGKLVAIVHAGTVAGLLERLAEEWRWLRRTG